MNSGAGGTETGGGEVGGGCIVVDDTGGEGVDMCDETGVVADETDNGGRIDVTGDTEDGEVDVDDEMDEETLIRGWCCIERTGSVDASDSGLDTAGIRGSRDCR